MKIHIVKKGETLSDISKHHGIHEPELMEINGLSEKKLSIGEELVIIVPTRVHTAKHGDTIERICLRYRVRKCDVLAMNPCLSSKKIETNQRIALKFDERTNGMAVTNGYIYKGTTLNNLERTFPYMTYATFAAVAADERGLHQIFDERVLLEACKKENKIPLLKIHESFGERYKNEGAATSFANEIIELAKSRGYKGLLLNNLADAEYKSSYVRFLVKLKELMIGSDLILLTEENEHSPSEFNEISDASILSYTKLWNNVLPSFDEGERKIIADYACNSESIKSFIELPSFARLGDGFIDIESAKQTAREKSIVTTVDNNTLTASYNTLLGKCIYPTLSNIKAVLELLSEYGYMGISFDVMRTPRAFLSIYNAMFKTVNYISPIS